MGKTTQTAVATVDPRATQLLNVAATEDIRKSIAVAERNGRALLKKAQDIIVCDEASAAAATDLGNKIRVAETDIDEIRKKTNRPFLDVKKMIDGLFSDAQKITADANAAITPKLKEYARKEREQREAAERERQRIIDEANRKAQEQMEAGRMKQAEKTLNRAADDIQFLSTEKQTVQGRTAAMITSAPWTFEIEAEAEIPREYCTPDSVKIRAAVKAGVRDIAGVRIFQDDRVSLR